MEDKVILEKEALDVAKQSSIPPLIFNIPVEEGRKRLEKAQDTYVYKYPANIILNQVNMQNKKMIKVYIVAPKNCCKMQSIIFYIHGAGWVFGSFHTHEKLVRELSYRTNSVVIFPEYTRSPEAKFPIAIDECYYILNQIPNILYKNNFLSPLNNLIVAGDSVGGNMAIAMCMLSKFNNGPKIKKLLLYYPVTNDNFNTQSYIEFASGYYLYKDGMKWFWDNYDPNENNRNNILKTPLKASIEQLKDFPYTLIINGEADVLKSEGEEFANKLRKAGNRVIQATFQGMIHDFVMLNSLNETNACRGAMDLTTCWINNNKN